MSVQEIQHKLSGYVKPGEQLLCGAKGDWVASTAARVAAAVLVHPAGAQGQPHLIGLTSQNVMYVFWNWMSGVLKTRRARFIPISDIANTEVKQGRNSLTLEILHPNGKMTRFVFKNTPPGNLQAADQLVQTLDQVRRGGYRAQAPARPAQPVRPPVQPVRQPPPPAYRPGPPPAAQQMGCPQCGNPIDADSSFCEHCGARVVRPPAAPVCPSCGKQLKPTAKFCSGCGTRVA